MFKNSLKSRLQKGDPVVGTFCKFLDPSAIEIAGQAGFDFVILDTEHGPAETESLMNLIRAAEVVNITPVIRISNNSEGLIQKALDIGAHGVQIPQVSTTNDASKVVSSVKFFPNGNRGICRFVRAAKYSSVEKSEYFKTSNQEVLSIIHIEGEEGIANIEQIAQLDGIDIIFLGPYDLSQSCGVPGDIHNPKVVEKMIAAVEIAKKNNKFVGTFVENAENAKKWIDAGVQYIAYSVDVGILFNAYRSIISNFVK